MTDTVWGDPIEVNGERPAWLANDDRVWFHNSRGYNEQGRIVGALAFELVDTIRLPADHFAYLAIAKGFTPWGGQTTKRMEAGPAPHDWDAGEVLYRNGKIDDCDDDWSWGDGDCDIIGYRRRSEQLAGDTVTIARMTEAQWWAKWHAHGTSSLGHSLGIIREPTEAERIAAETGIALADVERVLAARG